MGKLWGNYGEITHICLRMREERETVLAVPSATTQLLSDSSDVTKVMTSSDGDTLALFLK